MLRAGRVVEMNGTISLTMLVIFYVFCLASDWYALERFGKSNLVIFIIMVGWQTGVLFGLWKVKDYYCSSKTNYLIALRKGQLLLKKHPEFRKLEKAIEDAEVNKNPGRVNALLNAYRLYEEKCVEMEKLANEFYIAKARYFQIPQEITRCENKVKELASQLI